MTKRRKIILIVSLSIVILVILLTIPFRGWTRVTLIPLYAKLIYGTRVGMIYDNEFPPINNQLKSYGFDLINEMNLSYNAHPGLNTYEPLNGCQLAGYQGIDESLECHKVDEYKPRSFTPGFIDDWNKHSSEFVQYLESRGWHKQYSDQPSFVDLFKPPPDSGNWLTYVKYHGTIECLLTVAYNPPYPNPNDQVWVHEECDREVQFFRGY